MGISVLSRMIRVSLTKQRLEGGGGGGDNFFKLSKERTFQAEEALGGRVSISAPC